MQARWLELGLLAAASAVTLAAALAHGLALGRPPEVGQMLMPLLLCGLFLLLHLSLVLRLPQADPLLLPLVLCLMGLGLSAQARLAPALADRHALWLVLGCFALAAAAHVRFPWRWIRRYRYSIAAAGIGLVALTLVFGRSAIPGGPALWLGIERISFQPSELLKLLSVFFLAAYLDDKRDLLASARLKLGRLRLMPLAYLAPLAVILGLSLALLGVQGDLGAALLLYAIALAMLHLASGRASYGLLGLLAFAMGATWLHSRLYIVQNRVAIWLDPWSDPQGSGYQLVQSLMALAGGGVLGTGLGMGAPTSIPAVHTDFVYSALVEELGLAGAGAILLIYALLALRGFRVALRAKSGFISLLAAGLTAALAIQSLIIMGGVIKLIPLTGITLPFLSYGGTSTLTSAISVGLLVRISGEHSA